jgi:hypothetical protein
MSEATGSLLNWLVQFVGDQNFHWLLVCGLIAMAMLISRGVILAIRPAAPRPMDPEVAELIRALRGVPASFTPEQAAKAKARFREIYLESGETHETALVKVLQELTK